MSHAPPIARTLAGRHLVVTGATGFVGKVWLSHLLAHVPEIGRVTLLVRPTKRLDARERMAAMFDTSPAYRPLREAHGRRLGAFLDARVDVVEADLTRPWCGLDMDTVDRITATADAVVHIAGLTDFHPDPRKGLPANVDGTRHALQLAKRCQHPRLLHVSTCYVAGRNDGETPERVTPGLSPNGTAFDVEAEIAEAWRLARDTRAAVDRLDAVAERAEALGWPNLYTYTKGLAEQLVAASGVAHTTVRPSVVECARTWPMPGWNEGLNTSAPIMWFCGTPFLSLPSRAEHVFDIIPVDAVARWTTVALARLVEGTARPVYQLASGDVNPATFARIVELTALGKRRHTRRHGATLAERLVAELDVQPRDLDGDGPLLSPERLERWGRALGDELGEADPTGWLPGVLRRRVKDRVDKRLRRARREVTRKARRMGQLQRMLEVYQPFLHDHDWRFHTGHIRAEVARLHPDDRAAFGDEVETLCWRSYWLDVQYPGVSRWSFPIMDGEDVPEDPPSDPPLQLGVHPHPWDVTPTADLAKGVA